jgi:predicted amidophosphoribosyltransferase
MGLLSQFGNRHVTRLALAFAVWLVDLLLPRSCVACRSSADLLCSGCLLELRPLGDPCCGRCGAPTVWPVDECRECARRRLAFSTARAAVAYSGPARAVVRSWKEHGLRRASALAAELVAAHVERPAGDVITPIPPDPVRQLRRGQHPAEGLAAELARRWEVEPAGLLTRRGWTPRQAGLGFDERRRNIRGAFAGSPGCPERVVLVDDVYTTGATASAAAAALREAGAREVVVVTFARATR